MILRKYILILIAALIVIAATACSRREPAIADNSVTDAMNVASTYKKAELEAAPPGNQEELALQETAKKKAVISLTTAAFFNQQAASQVYARALQIALLKKHALQITYISFTEDPTSDASIRLTYTGTLRYGEDNKEKLTLEGTMVLVKEDGIWRVDSDRYNAGDVAGLTGNPL
jgi:hypothetical protein